MNSRMRRLGFEDGYYGLDIKHPAKQDYMLGYGQGYEQSARDDAFTDEQMKAMENEEYKNV